MANEKKDIVGSPNAANITNITELDRPILFEGKPIVEKDGVTPTRKKIVKVAKMIGGPSGMMNKIDGNAPEYYSLAGSVTDEEADFLLKLGLRHLRTNYEMAKRMNWDIERVNRVSDRLGEIGVIRVDYGEGEKEGEHTFYLPIFAPGLLEIMVVSKNAKEHPEIRRAFNQYTHDRMGSMGPMIPDGYGLMRVIPIERSLPKGEEVDPRDTLSYYIDKYDTYSVGACSCRTCRTQMGEGCGHLAEDRCIKLGKAAKYFVRTGKDRQISKEELYQIMEKCEDQGLMHCIPNIEGLDKGNTTAICDCCGCACFGLRPVEEFKINDAVASNYRAEVRSENCVACGKCVENCPVNAIRLGVKLPMKKQIKFATQKDLSNHTNKAAKTNADYRFTRQDVIPEMGTAPCKTACPAHIGIQGYIKMAGEGRYKEALALIKHENPFPAVCGRICNHACESACTRGTVDQAIAIDDIKKFIAEQELNPETAFVPWVRYNYSDKKIAIIGAGPSGLSCAYYLAQDGYDITVFEKEEKLGGMMTLGIPAFRLEKNVVEAEIDVLRRLGVKFQTGVEVGKDVTIPQLREQGYKGFYIAIGAQLSRKLGVPGEDHSEVVGGIDFLRDVNLGKGKKLSGNVVVVGGGNVAMDVARTALRQGAEKVDLYCLEQRNEMPGSADEIAEAEEEGIIIHNGWGPKEILKNEDGSLKGIEFKKCTAVKVDGRFNPQYDEATLVLAEATSILLAIGQAFDYGKLLEGTDVTLSKRGLVEADPVTLQTADPDIFVGGDCFHGPRFCIDAIANGKQAAISLHRYVQPGQSLTAGRDRRDYVELDKGNLVLDGFDTAKREIPAVGPVDTKSYKDNRGILTEEQIRKEAARCLSCGKAYVDPNICVGCGQCVLQCKFDAAHLVKKTKIYAKDFDSLLPKAVGHTLGRGVKIAVGALKRD